MRRSLLVSLLVLVSLFEVVDTARAQQTILDTIPSENLACEGSSYKLLWQPNYGSDFGGEEFWMATIQNHLDESIYSGGTMIHAHYGEFYSDNCWCFNNAGTTSSCDCCSGGAIRSFVDYVVISYEINPCTYVGSHGQQLLCSGCTAPNAHNYNEFALYDDGSCIFNEELCGEGTIWDDVSQTCVIDLLFCGWQPDGDGDMLIGVSDLLMLLAVFGDTDLDQDGIFDSTDDCVGAYDECGVCNGDGPSIPVIESIEVLYDSVYAEAIDEWWVFEVGADTTYALLCELYGCTDPAAENFNEEATNDDGSCIYPWACGDPVSYHGYDYETVLIGEQCWFAENLRTELYQNGDVITHDVSNGTWANLSEGAWISHADDDMGDYGLLYNWHATQDNGGLCPSGWNVPSDEDFEGLFANYESYADAGGALKSTGTIEGDDGLWYDPNLGATNSSGFNAIPSGQYICNPNIYGGCVFAELGYFNYMWTRTETSEQLARHTNLYSYALMTQAYVSNNKANGLSIRCIKD